jgi:hypothetical protein
MNRNTVRLCVLVVVAAVSVLSCGERATEPGNLPQAAGGDNGIPVAAIGSGGHGHDDLNFEGTLLVASQGGIIAVSPKGETFLFNPYGSHTSKIEVLGTRIFWLGGRTILEFDHDGNILATIEVPDRVGYGLDFAVLPGGDFAILDCMADSVYFLDPAGLLFEAVAMPEASPERLQNMRGLVMDGKLIVSETGTWKIAEIDLGTYTAGIFRDFSDPIPNEWFGSIEHQGRYYYVGRPRRLQRFTETGDLEDVADFGDEGNVMGFAFVRHKAYVAINFAGKIYEVNLSSGKAKCLVEGLDYPVDVEFIPVVLEPSTS